MLTVPTHMPTSGSDLLSTGNQIKKLVEIKEKEEALNKGLSLIRILRYERSSFLLNHAPNLPNKSLFIEGTN